MAAVSFGFAALDVASLGEATFARGAFRGGVQVFSAAWRVTAVVAKVAPKSPLVRTAAAQVAKALKAAIPKGFKQTKKFGFPHGQKVYEFKGKYYSKDIDGHNGGVWKVFEEVGGKLKRIGTADENLNIFKN